MQKFAGVTYYENYRGYFVAPHADGIRTRRMHRDVWEYYNGPIPAGHVVHHIDEDKSHNYIENLHLMTISAHNRHHGKKRKKEKTPKPRKREVIHTCTQCHKSFRSYVTIPVKYCSQACITKARYNRKVDLASYVCVICNKVFQGRKWRKRKVCSETCRRKRIVKGITEYHKTKDLIS